MCITSFFIFFNDTATTEIYTLTLHDALPISRMVPNADLLTRLGCAVHDNGWVIADSTGRTSAPGVWVAGDRKSTRLNSSHANISYAVFCLKKKKISDHHLSTTR